MGLRRARPQSLLEAFLQRVVDSGGRIEHGFGLDRTDLSVGWTCGDGLQRFVVECKLLRDSLESTVRKGLEQTAGYIGKSGAPESHLVIFDCDKRLGRDRVFRRSESISSMQTEVWSM